MTRKQICKIKFECNNSKNEFISNVKSQIGLFNAEHKADFITEIKDGNLSIGLGSSGHIGGIWYEPTITENDKSIIIDGAINNVSWHDDNTKWWQYLIMWILVFLPLYIVFSPVILFRLMFLSNRTPKNQLKIFMTEYLHCIEIKKDEG